MQEVLSEPEGAALLPLPILWMRMGIRNSERKSLGCERGERFRCVEGEGGWYVNEVVLRFVLELAADWRCEGSWCFGDMRALGACFSRRQEYIYDMRALSTSVARRLYRMH
jgi:hypothetical protein